MEEGGWGILSGEKNIQNSKWGGVSVFFTNNTSTINSETESEIMAWKIWADTATSDLGGDAQMVGSDGGSSWQKH